LKLLVLAVIPHVFPYLSAFPRNDYDMTTSQSNTACTRGHQASCALQNLRKVYFSRDSVAQAPAPRLPRTSLERLTSTSSSTILYLAYGSNLCAETFKGKRGIKPLSAVNVHVPSLDLTFDLPGIPYTEPCFANTRYRLPPSHSDSDYHKDLWHKGLIGVVYEVTPEDYRTIIATEGGGASYQDVIVPCFALPPGSKVVDPTPSGAPFDVHTLLSPSSTGRNQRPDPSYAQASARYLKLITDGAEEHELPSEYKAYLYNLRPYTITTVRQKVGQGIFMAFWLPLLIVVLGLGKAFADEDGKLPKWLVKLTGMLFMLVWGSYDAFFKKIYGDGERTIGQEGDEDGDGASARRKWCEKSVRLV
jgi:hypothetical protein